MASWQVGRVLKWGELFARLPQYVGSFAVEDLDLQRQVGWLEEQLRALKVRRPHWHKAGAPQGVVGPPMARGGPHCHPPSLSPGLPQEEVGGAEVQLARAEGLRCRWGGGCRVLGATLQRCLLGLHHSGCCFSPRKPALQPCICK